VIGLLGEPNFVTFRDGILFERRMIMDFRTLLGTSNKRRLALVERLYYHRDGWSSNQLLSELNCSLPILLNDIELINEEYPSFQITKTQGLYRLMVDKKVNLGNLYANILNTSPEFQIIEELLYEECDSITILAKKLYLSTSNTQRYLKKLEQMFTQADMELCYRPLRLEGNEGEIRNFYYRFYSERQVAFESPLPKLPPKHYHIIERYVQEFVRINQIHEKYVFQKRLIYNFYISIWRIKNGHDYPKEELRIEGLALPMELPYKELRQSVREGADLTLTPEMTRDGLWLLFSDSIVFSWKHRELAMKDNEKYRQLFHRHYELVEAYNELLGHRLTKQNCIDLATVLSNDFYLYDPDGQYLCLLWRNRTIFLTEVSKMYCRGVEKVRTLVEQFVHKYQMYQEEDFIRNYVYLLITTEERGMEWLASQEPLLKVLLLSELTPTEESFLAKQISDKIYGNFMIYHFEKLSGGTPQLQQELKKYDCLITTGSAQGLPEEYPVVVIDPFLTRQSTRWIQETINELEEKRQLVSVVE
jgi:DNA-binding Lrp family transcriptional regulator